MSNRLYGPSIAVSTLGTPPFPENSVAQSAPVLPALQTVTVNTETFILNPAASTTGAPIALAVPIPAQGVNKAPIAGLEQRTFILRGSGYLSVVGAITTLLRVYFNPTAAAGTGGTSLGNSGAITWAATAAAPFWFEFKLVFDSVSGKLGGTSTWLIDNQLVATAAISNVGSGLLLTNNPVITFVPAVTFGTANAGNKINLQEFAIYEV